MKILISIVALLLSVCGLAQPRLGMSGNYTITPSSALSTTPGIVYNSTITITCKVINKGPATFSVGGLSLLRVVKTGSTTSTVRTIYTASVTPTLTPGDSVTVTGIDSITPAEYKVNGNGNTIVVWPVSSSAATKDSLRMGPVYVTETTGIEELDRNNLFIYPNPTSQMLFVKPESGKRYKELIIYDIQLKALMHQPFSESADISALPPGAYIISVSDDEGIIYSSRFIKNN